MAVINISKTGSSTLVEVDSRQIVSFNDIHPFVLERSGNVASLYDPKKLFKAVGFSQVYSGLNETIPINVLSDTVNIDGQTSFANAGELFDALRDVFFLTSSSDAAIPSSQRVDLFEDLPTPAVDYEGQYWIVDQKSGTWILGTRKESGIYKSVSGTWEYRGADVPYYLQDDQFTIKDSSDSSKQLGFEVGGVTGRRILTAQDKDYVIAGLDDIPVSRVFGRIGDIVSKDDDYNSSQIQITTLDASYFDLDFTGYSTLRTGEYQLQATGVFLSNVPFVVNATAVYNLRVKVNNNSWHSIEIDFSNSGDVNNNNRKFYRSGSTFNTAVSLGWNERILQPQYESLKSIDDFINNPRVGQTTEGLINNTSVFENYLTQTFTPRRSGNFTVSSSFTFSLNDIGQDFIAQLQLFQGGVLVDSRDYVKEPKDSGSAGATLNVLSGGAIVGNANTSTNQRDVKTPSFDVLLTEGLTYSLLLNWAGSAENDLAAIYLAQTSIKENLTT